MSDPIAEYMAEEFEIDIEWTEKAAKQIRQQIGRELLETLQDEDEVYLMYGAKKIIREVCQLEEQK